jgi:hypothetical protein
MIIPLTMKKIGNRWGVTIYSVAEWLVETDTPASKQPATSNIKTLKPPARARASLGRSLLAKKDLSAAIDDFIARSDTEAPGSVKISPASKPKNSRKPTSLVKEPKASLQAVKP